MAVSYPATSSVMPVWPCFMVISPCEPAALHTMASVGERASARVIAGQRQAQHFRTPEVVMTETASMHGLENW